MYPLDPPAVYVHKTVMDEERYRQRVEGVVRALRTPVEPIVFDDEDLPRMIRAEGLCSRCVPMGTLAEVRDPILLFHTFRFDGRFEQRFEALRQAGCEIGAGQARPLLGYGAFHWANYNLEGDPNGHDKVCRPCWRIHLQYGCVHRCCYCAFGGLLVSMVNVEDYCRHLDKIIERHPWQATFLLDDDADTPCLEPEHGTLGRLIEHFGTLDGRYLVIHTKTWNTSWMPPLVHSGNTIIVWSLSGPTQSRILEPNTGTTEQRIQAARIAQEAGYPVRYKFKPIIPVRGWREEAAYTVRLLFQKTDPDIISLCVFMWHDVDEMLKRIGADLLDAACLQAALDARQETQDTRAKPFPASVRTEIYDHYLAEIRRHSRDVPVSLSTENFAMWKTFEDKLGFTATNYVCGCGPQSVPGARRLACHPFQVAVRSDAGLRGTYG
jgi:DNA repair photolyase